MKYFWFWSIILMVGNQCGLATEATDKVLNEYYAPHQIQSIYLQVSKNNRDRMLSALPKRIYVSADFRWRNVSIKNVAIRFKGNSSSNPNQKHKRSFLVRFDKFEKNQRFLGLKRVSFDNGIQFGSLFSEPIITEILRDQGIPSHRCNYAKVYLNNKYRGVYVNVERLDEIFIKNHLPDKKGILFKVDEGGPGCNLQYLGDNAPDYQKAFELKHGKKKKAYSKLIEFIQLINQSKDNAFLSSNFELDQFLRQTAVLLFSGAFDQLTGWNPHNYYLYHNAKNDRWRYLAWDLDVGFCETAFGRIPVLDGWNAAWPVPTSGAANPLLERIIADPKLLDNYRQFAKAILEKYFEPERLCKKIDDKYSLIKKDLQTDPFPSRRATNPTDRNYDDIVNSMKTFVHKRYKTALEQLKNPGRRPKRVERPEMRPQLIAKIRQIQRGAERMRKNGLDITPIAKRMRQVRPLIQKGKVKEAEVIIDEVLKLVTDKQLTEPNPTDD